MLQVTAINLYPIKSCRGIAVDNAMVEARGLRGDRRFMLIDGNNRFVTQRQYPGMVNLSVTLGDSRMLVDAPDREPLIVDLRPGFRQNEQVGIWRGKVEASIAEDEVNAWFSDFMGFECRLAYMADNQHRAVPHPSAMFDDEVSFADGGPLMLLSEASLGDLNARLAVAVTMEHFRPNLVVTSAEPFAEDDWRRLRIGDVELELAWPCSRCLMITVDPQTATRDVGGEPFETLKTYRRREGRVMFGQNAIPRSFGEVRVGDVVEVLREN